MLLSRELRVLDFDIETRRIGFHSAGRFAPDGCEPVTIGAAFDGDPVSVWSLNPKWNERDARYMVTRFKRLYDEADMVTGHYIRKFDLPILNGACLEWGLGPLSPKLVLDTKTDLLDVAGLSKSQENLSALLRLEESKFHMNDNGWRAVARLLPDALELAKTRVVSDVLQHQSLRVALADWLKPAVWKPS